MVSTISYFIGEIQTIGIFVIASFILSIALLIAVYILTFTSKIDFEKSSAYECGFQPFSEAKYPFEVQFALIGIMFLLFDIEVLYLFPLCSSILTLDITALIFLLVFFIIVTLGLLYEISRHIVHFFDYEKPTII